MTSGTYFWWWPVLGQYEATSQHYRCHLDDRRRASLPGACMHVTPCIFEVPQLSRTKRSSSLQASLTHKVFVSMLYVDYTKAYRMLLLHLLGFQACPTHSTSERSSLPKPWQSIKLPWLRHAIWNPAFLGSNDLGQTNERVFCTMLSPSCHRANLLSLASKPVLERTRQSPSL